MSALQASKVVIPGWEDTVVQQSQQLGWWGPKGIPDGVQKLLPMLKNVQEEGEEGSVNGSLIRATGHTGHFELSSDDARVVAKSLHTVVSQNGCEHIWTDV